MAIALFGELNEEWLRTFLALPHGIPSHDTLGRVLARLDASGFEEGFRDWVQEAFALTAGQGVPVDGKSVRGSHDRGHGLGPLHLVSAWAQANRLVPAQTAVEDGSNEITAIPELLRMLCLKGCIVTLDRVPSGWGCQKAIDAISCMGVFLAALHEHAAELVARPSSTAAGPPSIHASTITGGTAISIYPATCTVRVERRTAPGEGLADVTGELRDLVEATNRHLGADRLSQSLDLVREPFESRADGTLLGRLRTAAAGAMGVEPQGDCI